MTLFTLGFRLFFIQLKINHHLKKEEEKLKRKVFFFKMLIGGYEDSLKRLGIQSWQAAGAGAAPSYHFDMLQDEERNEAYRRGIEATVEEDDIVVDIGTSRGLLAITPCLFPE